MNIIEKFQVNLLINCNSVDRFNLCEVLREIGFKRIGVGKTFIHVDIDKNKSQHVMWLY